MPTDKTLLAPSPLKILLVDDDEDDAYITRSFLRELDGPPVELDWAPTYETGLTHLKRGHHHVGLVDYNLGSKNGIDLVQEVHASGSHPPIIMLTGQGNESLVLKALDSGAVDYLPKRILSAENLHRAILHGIEKTRLTAELESRQRQLEHSNQELQKRNEEIGRFYHQLAHELKTPLTAASEFVNILLEQIPGTLNGSQEEYLRLVHDCCNQLDRNINDLYDITRLETGKLQIDLRPCSLPSLISDVINYLLPKAMKKQIHLESLCEPHLPQVLIDAQRIKQVLLNLVGNAIKFTGNGGTITVSACPDPHTLERIRVSVQDTGIGIPADQLKHVFDRMFQVTGGSDINASGLGLGLFICREIVKLHGGTISASSTPGKGSHFSFTLAREVEAFPTTNGCEGQPS